jgi:predicted DCC family thiol-disulfide oxidoreductase YuxK
MTEHSSDQHIRPCLLIYDGQCRLCVTAKQGLERLETNTAGDNIRMIVYQSEEAKDILGPRYQPGRPDVAFLVGSDGKVAQGLDAFLPLLPGLKGGPFLTGLFRIPLIKPLGRLLYRFVARYRYRLFGEVPLEGHQGPAGDRSNRPTKSS